MKGSESRIFKMTNGGIYLNETEYVSYDNTNLPKAYFKFSETTDIYWLVNVQNEGGFISVEVVDYKANGLQRFVKQKIDSTVPPLHFKNMDWKQFQLQLASYSPNKINRELFDKKTLADSHYEFSQSANQSRKTVPNERHESKETILDFEFRSKLSEIEIKDGCVEFIQKIPELYTEVVVRIFNAFLRKEYNLIKEYFANKLGKKTIDVRARITLQGFRIDHVEATSKDIDSINQSFIDFIKNRQIKSIKQVARLSSDKNLHTIEEVLKHSEEFTENLFEYDIKDIIRVLTDDYKHRNSKQIIYLSAHHQHESDLVHLTLKPLFGFVFYFEDSEKLHYVWELLDSHATYVWSFPKNKFSKGQSFEMLEVTISEVHQDGRNTYKRKFRENGGQKDFCFNVVEHETTAISGEVLFDKWKGEVEDLIR